MHKDQKVIFQNDHFIISEDFRIISINESVARTYKGIKVGDLCYKVTKKRDTPCLHCPIAGNADCDCPAYYDPFYQTWMEAIFCGIGDGKYSVICRPVQNRSLRVFDSLGKEAKEQLTKELSGRAVNDRIIEMEDELSKASDTIEKANNTKKILLDTLSHDIRTPMSAILGFTRLLERAKFNPSVISNYVLKIKRSGDYLLSVLNNILEIVRIEDGIIELDENLIKLSDARESFLTIFENEVKKNKIQLKYELNVQHDYVITDNVKIQQIIHHLMQNAIKYTPAGGKIDISVVEYPSDKEGYGMYVTTVSDNGIGMTRENKEDLFAAQNNGNGLGMTIVKKYVDCMGGSIKVNSELGKGTTFYVTMYYRIANEQEIGINNTVHEKQSTNLKGKRVLLAEDNDLNAEITVSILEEYGLIVDKAEDGVVCIDKLNKAPAGYYDLVLMDIQMPNLDGNKTAELIRKLSDTTKSEIPIIAMTAKVFAEDKKMAINSGMNAYITKPVVVEDLIRLLEKHL